ncbi:MAG: hypothetical protein JEZ07_10910 [Phycisphaerae bacterium]|nr:hypothetical protein [Phycisphaerae bacterium]
MRWIKWFLIIVIILITIYFSYTALFGKVDKGTVRSWENLPPYLQHQLSNLQAEGPFNYHYCAAADWSFYLLHGKVSKGNFSAFCSKANGWKIDMNLDSWDTAALHKRWENRGIDISKFPLKEKNKTLEGNSYKFIFGHKNFCPNTSNPHDTVDMKIYYSEDSNTFTIYISRNRRKP